MSWYEPWTWADDSDAEKRAKESGDMLFGNGRFQENTGIGQDLGTSWEKDSQKGDPTHNPDFDYELHGSDIRNYQYGRTAGGADAAVAKAEQTGAAGRGIGAQAIQSGAGAAQVGANLMAQHNGSANAFNSRLAPQGEFSAQNQSLGQLGGLEAQQGPSAAQAQLQQGTNQAMAGQMALARSGRGFGGNAASAGLAQGNMAGIQANQANSAAALSSQENAAWRGRQAQNLGAVAGMQGQQANSNLSASLAGRGQNDQMFANQTAMGDAAYFNGQGAQQAGYGMGLQGIGSDLQGQQLGTGIRGQEMGAGATFEDNQLRRWAGTHGYNLSQQTRDDQKDAASMNAVATIGSAALVASDVRGKTRIASGDGAGQDFARSFGGGLGFDGTLMREQTRGGGPNNPQRPNPQRPEAAPPQTAMQAKYMGGADKPGALDQPDTRPESKPIDDNAFDAAAADAVRNSPSSFYDYKDPSAPGASAGRKYGPMAQDLAKTPAGASAVVEKPDGSLGVDTGRLALVHNGAINDQQKKIDELSAQLDAITGGQEKQGYGFSGYGR